MSVISSVADDENVLSIDPVENLQVLINNLADAHTSQKQPLYEQIFKSINEILDKEPYRDTLEMYRKEYIECCLPEKQFWIDWFSDLITSFENKDYITDIFYKAIEFYPDINVLAIYLGYIINAYEEGLFDADFLRTIFEKSVFSCGADILTGSSFWKLFREFEVEEYDDLVETSSQSNEIKEAKERVIKVYRRQLAIPLVDNETVLTEFDDLLSRIAVESDVKLIDPPSLSLKYETALGLRSLRMDFEYGILSEEYRYMSAQHQFDQFWKPYIDFEVRSEDMHRAQRLYERCILDCRSVLSCWMEYTTFSIHELKNWILTESICERGVRVHMNEILLWRNLLRAMEINKRPMEIFSKTIHFSLQNTYISAEDYLGLLTVSCDYHRRQLMIVSSTSKDEVMLAIERVRSAFSSAETFLDTYYPSWLEGYMSLHRYHCHVEEEIISDLADALPISYRERYRGVADKLWERTVRQHGAHILVWLECIAWARVRGSINLCRDLFRRATSTVADASSVCESWVRFESEAGGIDELMEAEQKLRSALQRTSASSKGNDDEGVDNAASIPHRVPKRIAEDESQLTSKSVPQDSRKKARVAKVNLKLKKFTVTVRKLSFECTEDDISAHFVECGNILAVKLVTTAEGKSRGIATIDFDSEDGREAALSLHGSNLRGRCISVELVKDEVIAPGSHPTTVFVSKMSSDTVEDDIRKCFDSCGNIVALRLLRDKISKVSKGSALIQFADPGEKSNALKLNRSLLNGVYISVLPSKFSAVVETNQSTHQVNSSSNNMDIDDHVVGEKETLLNTSKFNFKPRGLTQPPHSKATKAPPKKLHVEGINMAIVNSEHSSESFAASSNEGFKSNDDFRKLFN